MGGIGPILLSTRVGSSLQFTDPNTLRQAGGSLTTNTPPPLNILRLLRAYVCASTLKVRLAPMSVECLFRLRLRL